MIIKNNIIRSIVLTGMSILLFSCGGGGANPDLSNGSAQLANASYALTQNNNLYVSLAPQVWGKVDTTGIDSNTSYYQLRCGKDFCLLLGADGSIIKSTDLHSWSAVSQDYLTAGASYYDLLIMANNKNPDIRNIIAVGSGGDILVLPVNIDAAGQSRSMPSVKPSSNVVKLANSSDLYSIARTAGSGGAVAVGTNGSIVVTKDTGSTWVPANSPTNNNLYSVIFSSQGVNVAVGGDGTILTSTDGISWQAQNSGTSSILLTVNYVNGKYIVGGTNNTILISDDAIHWKTATINLAESIDILQIIRNPDGCLFAFGVPSSSDKSLRSGFGKHKNYTDAQIQQVFLGSKDGDSWKQMVETQSSSTRDGLSFNLFGNFFRVSRSTTNMSNSKIFNILRHIESSFCDTFKFKNSDTNT